MDESYPGARVGVHLPLVAGFAGYFLPQIGSGAVRSYFVTPFANKKEMQYFSMLL